MAKLQISTNYGNPYEQLRLKASSKKYFNQDDWKNITRGNTSYTIESYVDMLDKSENISEDELNKAYNFKYADDTTRLSALYNEIYADRSEPLKNVKIPTLDEAGNEIKDNNGETVMQDFVGTEYDYYKYLIKSHNDYNYKLYERQVEQERKDSMNGFVKFLANAGAVGTEFVYGFTKQVNDVVDMVGSLGYAASDAMFDDKNFADSYVEHLADDEGRPLQFLEDSIIEFESRYTDLRDLDGNYTNVGKYLGGVSSSLGQMVPSILVGKGLSAVGGTVAKSASAASQLVFYAGMTSGNIRDMYEQFAVQGVSVPSEQIIANAAIKSVLQWGVEVGLGKILGGSALDNLVFGRKVSATSSMGTKSLAEAAGKRLASDFAKEGLEEVLQDTSDFLVDQGFMYVINENFGSLSDLTWQSLFDAFIIGGIASFAGSAVKIVGTKSKGFEGNILNRKLAAWEYGLNIQNFVSTYDKIMKSEKYDGKTKASQRYVDAMTEMYASYRIIASIYGEIGEERFTAANRILTEITNAAKDGRFDNAKVRETANDLYESVFGEDNLSKQYEEHITKLLEEAKLAEVVAKLVKGEEVDIDENSLVVKAMNDFMEQNKKVKKVIATKYGENVIQINDTAIVPVKFLEVAGPLVANASIKEQELVQDVIDNSDKKYKINLDEIVNTYKKLTGEKKVTIKKAVTVLLLDENLTLYRTMLATANKDMYSFLSGLGTHLKMLSITDVADAVHKKALTNIVKRMSEALVEYLKVQPNANYQLPILSKAQIDSIKVERWANNIYTRVITGEELSERDMNVLKSRINNLPVKQNEKDTLLNAITSVNVDLRESAMKRIDGYYNNIFTTKYDGVTYMPMTSIPNMAFNNYLKNNNLTLKNWLALNAVDSNTKTVIVNTYGDFNEETLYKYRVKMFKSSVNNAYGIQIKKDKLYIVDKDDNVVGFSNYNSKIGAIITGEDVGVTRNFQTIVEDTKNLIAITKSLLNDSVSDVMANMVTIEDILYNPDLLKDDIRKNIKSEYGDNSVQSTFLYLRKFLVESTKDISIVAKPDGSYMFVNVKPMERIFKSKNFEITKDTELSDIINSSYLKGVLATTKIVVTNRDIAAEYVSYQNRFVDGKKKRIYENTIYVGKNTAEGSKDYLRFAIAHELEHVIEFENKLSLGMNQYWLRKVKQSVKNQIVADVKKHKPELFKDGMTREQQEEVISNFIYHTSGESMAMGLDATDMVDFYPTMVTYTDNDTVITMPWGTTYKLEQGITTFGINNVKVENNTIENALIKATKDYNILNIVTKPETCFIMPDGKLRSTDGKNHLDIITSINKKIDTSYFDTVPQINRDGDLYNIRISENMSTETTETLVKIINAIYKSGQEFTLERINYGTEIGQLITSDLAKDAQGILRAYAEQNNSTTMSLIKIADNLWEVEGIKDLIEVNEEYVDNVKPEFDYYSHERNYSLDYDKVHSNDYDWSEMLKIVNTYDDEEVDEDAIELAFEYDEYYFLDILSNNYKNIGLSEQQYHDVISVFETGISYDDPVTEAIQNYNRIASIIGKYIKYRDVYYLDKYINSLNLNENEKEVATNIYNYVIGHPENVYELLITNAGKTYKEKTLRKLYNDSIIDKNKLSYEEFLNIDIPFLRSQRSTTSSSNFVSIAININNERSFINLIEHMFMNDTKWTTNDVLIAGTVKLKDCLCYIDNEQNEVLLPTDKLVGTYEFIASTGKFLNENTSDNYRNYEQLKRNNLYINSPEAKIITKNQVLNEQKKISNINLFENVVFTDTLDFDNEYENYDYDFDLLGETLDFTNTETGSVITDEQVTTDLGPDDVRMSLAKNIKSETKKVKYGSKTETKPKEKRYLSYAEAKDTNLEYFYKKYTKKQMSPELKKFIASTTNRTIAPELMEKINGTKAGTLTIQDVMDYFRDTALKDMDEATFELINEAFFKNKVITTPKQLEEYLTQTDFYYAARVVVRGHKNVNQALVETPNADLSATFVNALLNADNKSADSKLFNKLVTRYRHIEKGNTSVDIDPNEKYLKTLWMRYFDGSLQTAGRVANIARFAEILGWNITGELRSKSIQESIGEDITLEDTLVDEGALADLEAIVDEMSGTEKRNALIFGMTKIAAVTIANKIGKTEEAAKTAKNVMEMLKSLSTKDLNRFMLIKILSDTLGIDYDKALDDKLIDDTVTKTEHTSWSIVNNMKSNTRTIKKRLNGAWQKKRFLKLYSDVFDNELNIKEDLYKNTDGKYKTTTELNQLRDKVREAKDAVLDGAFVSQDAVNAHQQHVKAMRKAELNFVKSLNSPTGKKEVKVIQIDVQDDYININATKEVPGALMQILDFEFTKAVKSKTKYLTNDTDVHFRTNFKEFAEANAERLNNLTQQDVDEIIDFYTNSTIMQMNASESKIRLYNAVQLYMSAYLLKIDSINNFMLSEEQREALTKRTELLISSAGQLLADWQAVSAQLKPAEDIINSMAKAHGVKVDPNDVTNLITALGTGNVTKIEIAKKQMYENTIKNHRAEGDKVSIFDRILQFQRVAMLSGPGTWVRNKVSNVMISKLNSISDTLGNLFTNKYKRNIKGQYKIIGTEVSTQTTNFVKKNLIDNGLFDSIKDSLIKYDSRAADKRSIEHNLAKMITKNIATDIFYNNYLDEKVSKFGNFGKMTKENINKWYKFVFKAMSDDKSVQKATENYFGKMLEESKVDLSHGLTNEVQEILSEAYTLAAFDYMHKPNVFNKIEAVIKNKGGTVPYFIYKQIFPFAGAAWNWFKEGLNYTPVGLINSIVKFAKMESTIAKYEDAYEKGETSISSKLARYILSRNIGKGVIGSIGTIVGALLVAFGIVRLDEEDDKYKIYCFDTHFDISELFGTQGIFLGMSVTQSIVDGFDDKFTDDEGNFKVDTLLSVFSRGFSTMMMESNFADFWNTVRYNGDIGDYFINAPFNSLQMFIPNWYKTVVSITEPYKVQYSAGIKGKIERLGATIAPWAYPKQVDVYTGEYQLAYKGGEFTNGLINAFNKLAPIKIQPYNVTDNEMNAVALGVNKSMLTGRYTINDKSVTLSSNEVIELNTYYGQLNKKDLDRLMTDKDKYEVKNDKGKYVKLYYSEMTDKQKATVIKRIMSNNSSYAKVYVLTAKGYKYYASSEEYRELVSLGITENVYRKTNKKEGFVEP